MPPMLLKPIGPRRARSPQDIEIDKIIRRGAEMFGWPSHDPISGEPYGRDDDSPLPFAPPPKTDLLSGFEPGAAHSREVRALQMAQANPGNAIRAPESEDEYQATLNRFLTQPWPLDSERSTQPWTGRPRANSWDDQWMPERTGVVRRDLSAGGPPHFQLGGYATETYRVHDTNTGSEWEVDPLSASQQDLTDLQGADIFPPGGNLIPDAYDPQFDGSKKENFLYTGRYLYRVPLTR